MSKSEGWTLIVAGIVVFTIFVIFSQIIYEAGYKDACKDFYNGKLRYDLVEGEWRKVK